MVLLLGLPLAPAAWAGTMTVITTVAGTGTAGTGGDGGAATSAQFWNPPGVALDGAGNLYIADANNNRIRKVNTSGVISNAAGTGAPGYNGDDWATSATLFKPTGVAFDGDGNMYIADSGNNRIRKVDSAGIYLSTVAGNGLAIYGGDGGPALAASLAQPSDVAVDSAGNLYIADMSNNRIRKVDAGGNISTVAGDGTAGYGGDGGPATSAQLNAPFGVALDGAGNLYIADTSNNRIRKVDTGGNISTLAGDGTAGYGGDGGPAASAKLNKPARVAFDSVGNLYIGDSQNHRIRKVDTSGNIGTLTGDGTAGYAGDGAPPAGARLNSPAGLAFDGADNLYIADKGNNRVRKVGSCVAFTVTPSEGSGGNISPSTPQTICSGTTLSYTVTPEVGNVVSVGGTCVGTLYGRGNLLGNPYITNPITADCTVEASFGPSPLINTVAGDGTYDFGGDGGPATSAQLYSPASVVVDAVGNLYIADEDNNRIRKVDASGVITTVAGFDWGYSGDGGPATSANLYSPTGVALDRAGNLYIADNFNKRIRKVDTNGIITTVAGNGTAGYSGDGGPATSAKLNYPDDVAVDSAGNLYISDSYNSRIRKVDASGIISTVAGIGSSGYSGDGGPATSAKLNYPSGIAIDGGDNLYISDSSNHRIRKVDASGIITTVAGDGVPGFGVYIGDEGPATSAHLNDPRKIAFDSAGNLYIADSINYRVRKVDTSGIITTVAGDGEDDGSYLDGIPAISTQVFPVGVALDGADNLYVVDGSRVRKVAFNAGHATTGAGWEQLGGTASKIVNSVAVDNRGMVYVGGQFDAIGSVSLNRLGQWDGGAWKGVGGGADAEVKALVTDSNNNLYVGGKFATVNGSALTVNAIAKWNGSALAALDKGLTTGTGGAGEVLALAMDGSDNLYAGGSFAKADTADRLNVAKWTSAAPWADLNGGLSGETVYALTIGAGGEPIAGVDAGVKSFAGGAWNPIGGAGAPSSPVNALAFDGAGTGTLYAGDNGGVVSTWDGANWSAIGGATQFKGGPIRGLALDIGGNLFAGGDFTTTGGAAYDGIARWDGTSWTALNEGVPAVMSVATDRSGNVYAATIDGVYIDIRRAVAGTPGGGTIHAKQCATFGLAHDPGTGTLGSIFGDDIAGDYCTAFTGGDCTDEASEWAAWTWDAPNSVFVPLQLTETLTQGTGYILCRNAMNAAGPASLKEDYAAAATPVITTGNCANATDFPNGCFVIPLVAPTTGGDRYNLAAYPFAQRLDKSRLKLEVDGVAEALGETHSYGTIWKLTGLGNSYDADDDYLLPMEAFWVKLKSSAAGKTVKLLVPKP